MLDVDKAGLELGIPSYEVATCREASHNGMHRLVLSQGQTYVQHVLTLESKQLELADRWWLRTHEGMAYVQSSAMASVWVKDLLHTSVFVSASGRMFLRTKKSAERCDTHMWLDEMSEKHSFKQLKVELFRDGFTVASFHEKIYVWHFPRGENYVFWELAELAKGVNRHCEDPGLWLRQNMRRLWLPMLAASFSLVESEHFMQGRVGQRANRSDAARPSLVHQNSVSTHALLLLVRHWMQSLQGPSSHLAQCLWNWLLARLGDNVTLYVHKRKRQAGHPLDYVEVIMRKGILQPAPALEQAVTRDALHWPSVGGSAMLVLRDWPAADLWLVHEVCSALARAIESKIQIELAENGESRMEVVSGNWFVDPDLRAALAQLGRNPYATSRITRKLGLRTGLHAAVIDVKAQLRYWLACKRVFQGCTTISTTMDATRFSKKDWVCGSALAVDKNKYAWVLPVVPFGEESMSVQHETVVTSCLRREVRSNLSESIPCNCHVRQALRDTSLKAVEAQSRGDFKVHWKQHALKFLQEAVESASGNSKKTGLPKKLERLSSFYLLHANDRQLQSLGFNGYADFYESSNPRPWREGMGYHNLPLLVEIMDSGSQNVCKSNYLLSKKQARVLPIWDIFHKRTNMCINAYKKCGYWPSLRLQSLTFEVNRGPWKSFAFFTQQVEAMESFYQHADVTDPLFQFFYPGICADKNIDPLESTPESVLREIQGSAWLTKLAVKTAATRWFSWHSAQEYYEPYTTERLMCLCFLGIHQGWFQQSGKAAAVLKPLVEKSKSGEGEARSTMLQAQEQESRMRDKCANALHLTATILADADIQNDCRIARYLSLEQRAFHSHYAHTLKTTEDGLQLAITLSSGERSLDIIGKAASQLGDAEALHRCGLQVSFEGTRWRKLGLEDAECQSQKQLMSRMGELLFAQINEEVAFMVMWTSTLPYKLAQMLLPDAEQRASILKTVREIFEAYAAAESLGGKFLQKLVHLTNLHWVVNKELFLLLEETDWQWSGKLETHLRRMWSNMGSTLVTERAFQSIRDHEKFSSKRDLSACSLWRKPSVDKVLDERHKYEEIDATEIPHHEVTDLSLPHTFFQPALKTSSD
eukprot:6476688-Amphidinium_carterae.1